MVALALANRAPERVRGLIVAAGYYFPTWRTDVWLLSGPAVPLLGDAMRYTVAPLAAWFLLPKLLAKLFAPQPVAPKFLKEFPRALALTPGQLRAAAEESALMIPAAARLAAHYRALACPVAVFAGRHDEVVEPEQARRLQQILPRAIMRNRPVIRPMVNSAKPSVTESIINRSSLSSEVKEGPGDLDRNRRLAITYINPTGAAIANATAPP